jgi:hypothetical protein
MSQAIFDSPDVSRAYKRTFSAFFIISISGLFLFACSKVIITKFSKKSTQQVTGMTEIQTKDASSI